MTKGEKNKARANDWDLFIKDVLRETGKTIVKTASGPEPSYSFRPGGDGMGFDGEASVCMYLYDLRLRMLFNMPEYTKPGSHVSFYDSTTLNPKDNG